MSGSCVCHSKSHLAACSPASSESPDSSCCISTPGPLPCMFFCGFVSSAQAPSLHITGFITMPDGMTGWYVYVCYFGGLQQMWTPHPNSQLVLSYSVSQLTALAVGAP